MLFRSDFLPTPGPVNDLRTPAGPYIRTDTGVYAGCTITPDYDPMIAKVISWGANRDTARRRLDRALMEFALKGCTTNTMFLRQLLSYKPFIDGVYDTSLIENYLKKSPVWYKDEHKIVALIGAAIFNFEKEKRLSSQTKVSSSKDKSNKISLWRTNRLLNS